VIGSGAEETRCWAENWRTFLVLDGMGTQINICQGGVIGFRYEALPLLFDLHNIKPDERGFIFDGLREMERAAVQQLNGR